MIEFKTCRSLAKMSSVLILLVLASLGSSAFAAATEKPCPDHLPIPCKGPKGGCYSSTQHCNGYKECPYGEDEINCTATIITKHLVIDEYRRSDSNLAWLVTPVIFAIGVVYAVYKCFKEGICNRERYRYRNRSGDSNSSDYVALDNMTFYSIAGIPVSRVQAINAQGEHPHPRVMVVHNHNYAVTLARCPHIARPPTYDQAVGEEGRQNAAFSHVIQEDSELPPYQETDMENISLSPPPGSPPCEYPPPPPFPDSPRNYSHSFSLPGTSRPSIGTLNLNISRRTSSSSQAASAGTSQTTSPTRRTSTSTMPPVIAPPPPGPRRSRHSSAPQGLGRHRHNSQPQNRQRHLSSHAGPASFTPENEIDSLL